MEVSTPALSFAGNTDPVIESFVCEYQGPGHAAGSPMYLQTSPEFFMKRLLAAGSGSIYQIARVFRNNEAGRWHNPEFSLLEWYRLAFDYHALMNDVASLLDDLFARKLTVRKYSYRELFEQHFSVNPHQVTAETLKQKAGSLKLHDVMELVLDTDGWLELLMNRIIEPAFDPEELTFVYDYPVSQASLAKVRDESGEKVAERFEVFLGGAELANGFTELQDADEQRRRFQRDNDKRKNQGKRIMPLDTGFLNALSEPGLPACSGVALGLDRLLMLISGRSSIKDVLAFPVETV